MGNRVKQKFDSYPKHIKPKMERLRRLIFEVAEATDGVGELEETLKWSEPAYLPSKTKSGTTVRIDWKSKNPDQIGMYVSCNTSLIDSYRTIFSDDLEFEGTRAVVFPADKPIPEKPALDDSCQYNICSSGHLNPSTGSSPSPTIYRSMSARP